MQQKPQKQRIKKFLAERLFHAFLFEALAIGISAPLAAWLTGESMFSMGVLTGAIAVIALLWNMLYNIYFDRIVGIPGHARSMKLRVGHTAGFEFGLLVVVVPLAAWWLQTSLWQAFVLDIGLILFYLPYTFVFNLVYDRLRLSVFPEPAVVAPGLPTKA